MIRRKIPFTSQPPVGVGANPKWINRGLVALFDVRQARELISGDFATNKTSLLVPASGGMAMDFSGTANQQYAHRPAYAVTGDISIVVVCDIDALTNFTPFISKQASSTTYNTYECRMGGGGGTTGKATLIRGNASAVNQKYTTANVLTAPFSNGVVVFTQAGGVEVNPTAYINRVAAICDISSGAVTGASVDNGSAVWIGRRSDTATQLDGRIYYIGLFNRAITASEVRELSELGGRWDIYAPQTRNIFVSVAGGGVTETTASSSGVATATGVSGSINASDAASSGTGTATGVGAAVAESIASSAGIATVSGDSGALAGVVASSTGVATASADAENAGAGIIEATASADGAATALGISGAIAGVDANASGVAAVDGVSGATAGSVGAASGQATATGVGADGAVAETPGQSLPGGGSSNSYASTPGRINKANGNVALHQRRQKELHKRRAEEEIIIHIITQAITQGLIR